MTIREPWLAPCSGLRTLFVLALHSLGGLVLRLLQRGHLREQGLLQGAVTTAGTCGCTVATEEISGPTAAYNITASCTVSYLEEFGNEEIVEVVASNPVVRGTFEYYAGAGTSTGVTIGDTSVTLSETVALGNGGRGSVGGFATISANYIAGDNGDTTCGMTIA